MKKILFFLFSLSTLCASVEDIFHEPDQGIVLETKQIYFERYPDAFNPSIIKNDEGFILVFRYCPDRVSQSWVSQIGIVQLDQKLNPISEPQILNTRPKKSKTPSQAEDPRIFPYRGKLFLIYNDNINEIYFDHSKRRDMFIAELQKNDQGFTLSTPLKLFPEEKYNHQLQQKNWVPFEWDKNLFLGYSIMPHEILAASLRNGHCSTAFKTETTLSWIYGNLRGGTPPQLFDGEYLAFFHSAAKTRSPSSYNWKVWHYFMGAYTFSTEPPFNITQMTPKPIIGEDFYTPSYREKRVIFPGGFAISDNRIYVAYGKDDCELWIATLDKTALKAALKPIPPQ